MDGDSNQFKQVEALADILTQKGLTEIEYEGSGLRIRVSRLVLPEVPSAASGSVPASSAVAVPVSTPDAAPEAQASSAQDTVAISSPMVGTFYEASSPESPPFVNVGDRVRKGQVICIIEAMKLMNEIESECDGVVVERLVENAQGVEFEQPLFRIAVG